MDATQDLKPAPRIPLKVAISFRRSYARKLDYGTLKNISLTGAYLETELKDLTTGETVFKSSARNSKDKIGLDYVDYFSSSEGIAIYKDHEYQLISSYNNTTDTDQDSMAVIYMYVLDREYKKPNLAIAEFLIMKPSDLRSGDDL